jgi:putative transposase
MQQAGVVVQRPKQRGPVTTESRHGYAVAPNLLARQFDVARPDHVWVGEISEVWTAAGWL